MRAASFELLMALFDGEATAVSRAREAEQRSPSTVLCAEDHTLTEKIVAKPGGHCTFKDELSRDSHPCLTS